MTAYATELDICPAYGWQGGPELNTRVTSLRNGHERRNARWSQVRHRFVLPLANIENQAYLIDLKATFLAMRGQLHSFLVKDWSDFEATGESLGDAPSGTTAVQLRKMSTFGVASYERLITKPKAGTVIVYQDTGSGPVEVPGTIDTTTGLFTPDDAWSEGDPLTADFQFYVPVRFASDLLPMTIDNRSGAQYRMNGAIELVEVFGE